MNKAAETIQAISTLDTATLALLIIFAIIVIIIYFVYKYFEKKNVQIKIEEAENRIKAYIQHEIVKMKENDFHPCMQFDRQTQRNKTKELLEEIKIDLQKLNEKDGQIKIILDKLTDILKGF